MFEYSHLVCKDCGKVFLRFLLKSSKKCTCKGSLEELKVVGSWGISNVASLNVFKIEDDKILVAVNDLKPDWYEIRNWDVDDLYNGENYIVFGGEPYYLSECISVR